MSVKEEDGPVSDLLEESDRDLEGAAALTPEAARARLEEKGGRGIEAEALGSENETDLSENLADRLFDRYSKSGSAALGNASELFPRRTMSFIMGGDACSPHVFWNAHTGAYIDFKVTMRSLSSAEEIQAMRSARDGAVVQYNLARASFYAINGKPIPADRKDFYWEAFGMGGRQMCMVAFQMIGSAGDAALGKFQSTSSIG